MVFTLNYSAIGNETKRADIAVVTVPGTGTGVGPLRALYSVDIEVVTPLLVRVCPSGPPMLGGCVRH